jgi:hypothetical protein
MAVGLIIAYMFDVTNIREGSLIVMWITLFGVMLALLILVAMMLKNNVFLLFLLGCMNTIVALSGIWVTMQFRWLQRESPSLALVLERMLLAGTPIPASVLLTWAAVSAYGFDGAAFYLLAFMFLGFATLVVPQKSSFLVANSPGSPRGGMVVSASETQILLGVFLLVPFLLHVALYHSVLFEEDGHGYLCVALLCLPVTLLRALGSEKVLWWIGGFEETRKKVLDVAALIAMLVLLWVVEMRIIFFAYSHYILLPAPLSYAAVAVALYGGFGTAYLIGTGMLQNVLVLQLIGGSAAAALGLAMGLPPYMVPAPVAGAIMFAQFHSTKKFGPYIAFAVSTMVAVGWFAHNSFWFLEFQFVTVPLSLHQFSLAAELLFGLCLVLPGLTLTNIAPGVSGLGFIFQALLVCSLELTLFWQGEGMYPAPFLIITTVIGYLLADRLHKEQRVTGTVTWVMMCIYGSKLCAFLVDDAWAYPATILLALTVSPLYMGASSDRYRKSMPQRKAWAHVMSVALASLGTKDVLLGKIIPLATGQDSMSESALIGCSVVAAALALTPLAQSHFRHIRSIRQLHTFCVMVGMLLVAISPEFGQSEYAKHLESYKSSFGHAVVNPADHDQPVQWLLFFALVLSAATVTSMLPLAKSLFARVLVSGGVGASVGLYVCFTFLAYNAVLYGLCTTSFVTALVFIVFTRYPTALSHRAMPITFGIFAALLPVTYLTQAEVYMDQHGVVSQEAFLRHRTGLVAVYAVLCILVSLASKLNIAAHTKAAVGGSRTEGRRKPWRKAGAFAGASFALQMDYLPICGNIATCLAYGLCIFLNMRYLDGSLYCILVLAPMMLLLSPGRAVFSGLEESRRYAPVLSCVLGTAALASVVELYQMWAGSVEIVDESGEPVGASWLVAKHVGLLLVSLLTAVPAHIHVWRGSTFNEWYWMTLAPLNMVRHCPPAQLLYHHGTKSVCGQPKTSAPNKLLRPLKNFVTCYAQVPGVLSDVAGPYILGWVGFVAALVFYGQAYESGQRGMRIV